MLKTEKTFAGYCCCSSLASLSNSATYYYRSQLSTISLYMEPENQTGPPDSEWKSSPDFHVKVWIRNYRSCRSEMGSWNCARVQALELVLFRIRGVSGLYFLLFGSQTAKNHLALDCLYVKPRNWLFPGATLIMIGKSHFVHFATS